jgi:hypothetical protein
MKIKSIIPFALLLSIGMVSITGCQKGDLIDNPNVAGASSIVPPTLLLNALTANLIRSAEQPFAQSQVAAQFDVANYSYYRGSNSYNFGNTSDSYDILKYALKLQQQTTAQLGNQTNKYYALGQFFKAYAGIWLSQRVGDIPFSAAGDVSNLTPKYDTQHDVYKSALALLDNANTLLGALITANPSLSSQVLDAGDIYGYTYLQWQKLINTYRLRILISLSKRVSDNADLSIPTQFATIINNPTQYPIMSSNSDNLVYKYNAVNRYATFAQGYDPYNNFANVGGTYISLMSATNDPRIFAVATPAPAQVAGGKGVSDFTAYVGSDPDVSQAALLTTSTAGGYSFSNFTRYYTSNIGANAEPFVFIGYSEMCFNIAEAVNRGWVTGSSAATWYTNGINASLANYGITDGKVLTITYPVATTDPVLNPKGLKQGDVWGTATVNLTAFYASVAYAGNTAAGLTQILTQKYISLDNNSGWEAFYNFRRTGVPALAQGGSGIGTPNNLIPRRWQYPATESAYNTANYQSALSSQFGGTDDPTKDTWLTK